MEMENLIGLVILFLKETLKIMIYMDFENIVDKMEEFFWRMEKE